MARYQGTFLKIQNDVMAKVRLDTTDDLSRVKDWINLAYVDAVMQTEALQATADAPMTAGVDSYQMPTGVLVIKRLVIEYSEDNESYPMKQVPLQKLLEIRKTNFASGTIVDIPVYSLVGQNQIEVWPVPAAGWDLEFWYVYAPDALSGDSDQPVLIEPFGTQVLVAGACVEAARFKKDPLLGEYEQSYQYWINRYKAFLNHRSAAGNTPARIELNQGFFPLYHDLSAYPN